MGAKEIIPGVFYGGELSREQIADPATKVRKYMGYAAWFSGQLDGEVMNNDWSFSNTATADEVWGEP